MITGPWNVQTDGTVTTVAGTHKGTRVVATCERMEDAKAIATVPDLIQFVREVAQDRSGRSIDAQALLARAEGLRG